MKQADKVKSVNNSVSINCITDRVDNILLEKDSDGAKTCR